MHPQDREQKERTDTRRVRLITLLKELFQLDQPDLDFGFYKIMHAKAEQVSGFIKNDLLQDIENKFGKPDPEKVANTRKAYKQRIDDAKAYGVPRPEDTKPVQEARALYEAAKNSAATEGELYEHLYRFFSRYYDNGDFISRRHYARENAGQAAPYAVPYDGSEVYLHWANRDQYYIKTSEYLTNCSFDIAKHWRTPEERKLNSIPEQLKLHCRLINAAEGEHNNNKTSEKNERFFLIHDEQPVIWDNGELVLQFEYRPDNRIPGTGIKRWQEKLLEKAEAAIFNALVGITDGALYSRVLSTEIGEDKAKKRTLLRKYLNKYTKRNTSDYFIHKDLDGFLRRELDFYIKNEVMQLDNIEGADAPAVELYLDMIKVLRKIGGKLITFLAQCENFQKKLWLKKKFVSDTQYCITLDRIPEAFYPQIVANAEQHSEWVHLFAIDEIAPSTTSPGYSDPLSVEFLKANPFLVLDTKFFPAEFTDRLIASIEGLDYSLDGLLIHSENFQALNLMQAKYKEQVKCIYIDPPYNTGNDGFIYKDHYQHSGWLSMMTDRLLQARAELQDDGVIFISIDDNEQANLKRLCDEIFGKENFVANVVWEKKYTRANDAKWFSDNHDHLLCYSKNKLITKFNMMPRNERQLSSYSNPDNHPRGDWKATPLHAKSGSNRSSYTFKNGITWSPPTGTFRRFNDAAMQRLEEDNEIWFGKNGAQIPSRKSFLRDVKDGVIPVTLWRYNEVGHNHEANNELKSLELGGLFNNPKPTKLIQRCIILSCGRDGIILDYFAGSGTTGHAVVNLNREDGGTRKYIMVEMGNYFDTLTKPRMQKVVYSKDWKDGKPVSREGISHAFKYIRLESYEDTLNNLSFQHDEQREQTLADNDALRHEYRLRYWLDMESKDSPSLLNIDQFRNPRGYSLSLKAAQSDSYIEQNIDLVETFNWLLGVQVDRLGYWQHYSGTFIREPDPELPKDSTTRLILKDGLEEAVEGAEFGENLWSFRAVEGRICTTPGDTENAERVLIIWRTLSANLEEDNVMLDAWFQQHYPSAKNAEFVTIYVNGSSTLGSLCLDNAPWSLRLIEDAFHQVMWGHQRVWD